MYVALCNHYSTREANERFRHPLIDHLEDLLFGCIGVVKSCGIDKDELIAVFSMTQDPIREDSTSRLATLSIMGTEHDSLLALRQSIKSKSKIT